MSDSDLIELRAALIQIAKAQESERACILRILHIVERQIPAVASVGTVTISERDSIASAAKYVTS